MSNIEKHRAFLDSLEGEKGLPEVCDACGGDGKETCNNPDHGFGMYMNDYDGGNHGCPICGHDPKHKVPNGGSCDTCKGTGKTPAKGLPEEMHGFNLHSPVERLRRNNDLNRDTFSGNKDVLHFCDLVDVLLVRIEYLESRQIPDLKEKVKELVRDAMDAQAQHQSGMGWTDANRLISEFRTLCAPDKVGEVKP